MQSPQESAISEDEEDDVIDLGLTEEEVEQKLEEELNKLSPATQALLERLEAG
jgi:hypothetical protein